MRRKAVALFSGGLDSTLAIKVVLDQGIEVVALNFMSPFCRCQRGGCSQGLKERANNLGVEFKSIYLGDEYLQIVRKPEHGYGKNLNPCIDCRIIKFRKAKLVMKEIKASFLISGEVLGQRPMSQHRQALGLIEKEAEVEDLVLRPLSAKLFEPTLAEREGWVKREALLDISGRTRKPQIKLASQLGIKDYACPAGGCLLTDSTFSKRLKDVFEHDQYDIDSVELLKIGRHFRISPDYKLILGRNEAENNRLANCLRKQDLYFEPKDLPGPSGLGRGRASRQTKQLSSSIVARYTATDKPVDILVRNGSQAEEEIFSVEPAEEERIKSLMIY